MPRRARVVRREVPPDAKYQSQSLTMFVNKIMRGGKKSVAERITYKAMDILEAQTHRSPLDTF